MKIPISYNYYDIPVEVVILISLIFLGTFSSFYPFHPFSSVCHQFVFAERGFLLENHLVEDLGVFAVVVSEYQTVELQKYILLNKYRRI